jgi:hypothetical protein
MKTSFILAFAMLFFASLASAQSNEAIISQVGTNHVATTSQTGAGNYSSIDILSGSGSEVTVSQVGARNDAQFEGAGSVVGSQTQIGDDNSASAGFQSFGNGSVITQYQEGDRNSADASRWTQSSNIVVTQTQIGNDNQAVASRLRGFSTLEIDQVQTGNRNRALLNSTGSGQVYADGGFVRQIQEGDDNLARIERAPGAGSIGGTLIQEQYGDQNESQIRTSRTATLAETYQTGDFNMATITQFDSAMSASISQIGDNNTATITQGN